MKDSEKLNRLREIRPITMALLVGVVWGFVVFVIRAFYYSEGFQKLLTAPLHLHGYLVFILFLIVFKAFKKIDDKVMIISCLIALFITLGLHYFY